MIIDHNLSVNQIKIGMYHEDYLGLIEIRLEVILPLWSLWPTG